MKTACVILTIVIIVAIMAVCVMVKYATDISVQERQRSISLSSSVKIGRSMGVIDLKSNTTTDLPEKYPFVAALMTNTSSSWVFSCFGSIIQVKWVVTSAHCRTPGSTHRVVLFVDIINNRSHTYPILFWRMHEKYAKLPQHDIAVAKLNVEQFADTLKPAYFDDQPATQFKASIWKTVSSMDKKLYLTNDFDEFNLSLVEGKICSEVYGVHIDDSLICVDMTKYDDCFVHEFGPLFVADKVVGILALKPKDCDVKYAVFTNVSFYSEWVSRTTQSLHYG